MNAADGICTPYGRFPSRFRKRRVERAAILIARHLCASGDGKHEYVIGGDADEVRITAEWMG